MLHKIVSSISLPGSDYKVNTVVYSGSAGGVSYIAECEACEYRSDRFPVNDESLEWVNSYTGARNAATKEAQHHAAIHALSSMVDVRIADHARQEIRLDPEFPVTITVTHGHREAAA